VLETVRRRFLIYIVLPATVGTVALVAPIGNAHQSGVLGPGIVVAGDECEKQCKYDVSEECNTIHGVLADHKCDDPPGF